MADFLTDRPVLVTGGSRGIGAAIVRDLAAAGARVAFTYLGSQERAEALQDELRASGGQVLAFQCDSRSLDAAREGVKRVEEEFGPLYGLVNNAGITRDQVLAMMKEEQWQEVIDTDLNGVFHFCRAAVFGMSKRKAGRIVSIGSISGIIGNKGQTNYSAAKAGVIGLSKALAKEVARFGITVNVVAPGYIETEMTDALGEKAIERIHGFIPMGRFGRVEDVAALTRFLLDEHAGYITGQVLTIDGGIAI